MPRRRDERRRVLGPYDYGNRQRIIVIDPGESEPGRRRLTRDFAGPDAEETARRARAAVEARWAELEETTVGQAIDGYQMHLERKGNRSTSIAMTLLRLRRFFSKPHLLVASLRASDMGARYEELTAELAPDTHRNILAESKSFLRWCVSRGWLRSSPLEDVEGVGRRRQGKSQLTADEARKFHETALYLAHRGDHGALGVLMTLLMGLRNSEVTKRIVRDLDQAGAVLRVWGAKTAKGNRLVGVPEVLRPLLVELGRDRGPLELLFGAHTRSWLLSSAHRVCRKAGVQYAPPHGLRGTHASLAEAVGATPELVASALGHESVKTTHAHYAAPEAVEVAKQQRALSVLQGGRR